MKHQLFILTFFIFSLATATPSQDSLNIDSIQNNRIGFAYGPHGMSSRSVRLVADIVFNERYDTLRLLIGSDNPSLKYLSIKACEFLDKNKIIFLTLDEKTSISLISKSVEKLEYRSGCTVGETISIKNLYPDKKHPLNKEFNFWIKELIKIK